MDIIAIGAAFAVMGAIVTAMMALQQGVVSPRASLQRRLGSVLSGESVMAGAALDYQSQRAKRVGRIPLIGSFLRGQSWTDAIALRLDQADIKLTVSEYVSTRILMAGMLALAAFLYFGGKPIGIIAMAGLAFGGYLLPAFYVSFARGRRIGKLNTQLIEALSLVSNSLKAGFGLMQSLDLASHEMPHPISTELRRTLHDINVGSTTEEALLSFSKRSGSEDLDIVITAMVIQQSTGGNLAEILDNVGHTMRERIRIRGEIKTLTTQQLLTGFIIGGLPIAMLGVFSVISPAYVQPLYSTTIGNLMLVAGGFMEFAGIMVIKKILQIEV